MNGPRIQSNTATATYGGFVYRVSISNATSLDSVGITRSTTANGGAVVTSNNHGFENGDVVVLSNVEGMEQVNYDNNYGNVYTVAYNGEHSFTLTRDSSTAVDSGSFGKHSSGGFITKIGGPNAVPLFNVFNSHLPQ